MYILLNKSKRNPRTSIQGGSGVVERLNEPAGWTTITQNTFNTSLIEDGWDTFVGDLSRIQDPTCPTGSPSWVAYSEYPKDFEGGGGTFTLERSLTNTRNLYGAIWVKPSSNFQGHGTATNKLLHIWVGGSNRLFYMMKGVGSGPLDCTIGFQGVVGGPLGTDSQPDTDLQYSRGNWNYFEVAFRGNVGNAANGRVTWWLNNILVKDYTGMQFTPTTTTFELIKLNNTWGGTGDSVAELMSLSFDNMYFSGSNT